MLLTPLPLRQAMGTVDTMEVMAMATTEVTVMVMDMDTLMDMVTLMVIHMVMVTTIMDATT